MEVNGFKRKKRFDFKKWVTGSNSLMYLIILLLLLAALLFALNTVLSMRNNSDDQEDGEVESTTEFETQSYAEYTVSEATTIAKNQTYYIKVSKNNNFIVIYEMDDNNNFTKPFKAFKVSVGVGVKSGVTSIAEKSNWRKVNDYLYGRFASRLDNSECLYSAAYYSQHPDNLNPSSYNKIGTTVNEGSIFMTATNAKWIYENCGVGTTVEIIDDYSIPDGVVLEAFERIPDWSYRDPLDNPK